MNETLANIVVARLKQDGRLPLAEIVSRIGAARSDVEDVLKVLVGRGDVKLSPRQQYYAAGQPSAPAPLKTRAGRTAKTAVVEFGVRRGGGVGVEVDGYLVVPGDTLSYERLNELFHVGNMGGIRISKATGTILLISSVHNDLYDDRDHEGLFNYTGEGQNGDQTLTHGNKAVDDSPGTGTPLLLFFKKATNEYEFQGEARLAAAPFQEQQPGADGLMRCVWVFPLEIV